MENEKKPNIIGVVIPGNVPVPVNNTDQAPYYFVGLLQITFPDGTSGFGTATLIQEPGSQKSQYVLTCAHNLYNKKYGGKAKSITFQRGFDYVFQPYPSIDAADWYYPDGYPDVAIPGDVDLGHLGSKLIALSTELDYGLVKLSSPIQVGSIPEMTVKTTADLTNLSVQINGYGYYQTTMSHATGNLKAPTDTALFYPISTMGGASGSAIMMNDNQSIVGIHTTGVSNIDPKLNINQGVRITQTVMDTINGWMGAAHMTTTSTNQIEE